jgi:hypothetical protein
MYFKVLAHSIDNWRLFTGSLNINMPGPSFELQVVTTLMASSPFGTTTPCNPKRKFPWFFHCSVYVFDRLGSQLCRCALCIELIQVTEFGRFHHPFKLQVVFLFTQCILLNHVVRCPLCHGWNMFPRVSIPSGSIGEVDWTIEGPDNPPRALLLNFVAIFGTVCRNECLFGLGNFL